MRKSRRAFSLVEVAIALGILGFVILAVVGLLSVGLKSNQVSVEETRAALMLTMLETDLRNTHPGLNSGKSAIFHLPLPYSTNASGYTFNPSISSGSFFTSGVTDAEKPTNLLSHPRYQASVTYLEVPSTAGSAPITARIVVNWPGTNTADGMDVVDPAKVRGSVESLITFPAP